MGEEKRKCVSEWEREKKGQICIRRSGMALCSNPLKKKITYY